LDQKIITMNRALLTTLALGCTLAAAMAQTKSLPVPPIASGPFKPDWNSLTHYQTPEWFRDAKFGIWAHLGPQCQPEHGDWYARYMYDQSHADYKSHLVEYGPAATTAEPGGARLDNSIMIAGSSGGAEGDSTISSLNSRLDLYKQSKPCHEPSKKP
jgi:hypothetical protein